MSDQWLSHAYLGADGPGGHGVIIDSGGPPQPLLDAIERDDLTVEHLLLTHHHHDHGAENHVFKERLGVEILAHPLEAERLMDVDRAIEPGEVLEVGGLRIDGLHTPGHTAGMLSFRVNDSEVFTGDTLFKGSVGGVRAPGSTTFEDLKASVMDVLMRLPPETTVHPGHTDPTTIGDEWEANWYLPRNVPPPPTACGFPPDSQAAIARSSGDAVPPPWVLPPCAVARACSRRFFARRRSLRMFARRCLARRAIARSGPPG